MSALKTVTTAGLMVIAVGALLYFFYASSQPRRGTHQLELPKWEPQAPKVQKMFDDYKKAHGVEP